MKNDLLTIGGFTIHGYGLMIGLGFVAAYFMTEYRASKQGLDSDKIISLVGWTIIAGLICAKLLYYVTILTILSRIRNCFWTWETALLFTAGLSAVYSADFCLPVYTRYRF